jgi:hypothetical protein
MNGFTPQEISFILGDITPLKCIPQEISQSMVDNMKRDLTRQLKNITFDVSEDMRTQFIDDIKNEINYHRVRTIIEPGSMMGVIAGQSIGQPVTQSTLNSFHYSGVASARAMVMGVKKFLEILNATQNPKTSSCKIYYPLEYSKNIKTLRESIGNTLVHATLEDFVDHRTIIYDVYNIPEVDRWWYYAYETLFHDSNLKIYKWCVRLHLDKAKLFSYRVTPMDIVDKLESYGDVVYIGSPLSEGIIDLFIKTSHLILPKKDKFKDVHINESIKTPMYINMVCKNLFNQSVAGIPFIDKVYFAKDQERGGWYVETEGSNLKEVMTLSPKNGIIPIKNIIESDNMWEIYDMFGIEATRAFLIKEITNFIGFDGTYIDHHHIDLLVDSMTWDGTITSVSRYGIDRNVGPLAKASFEENLDNLLKAGIYNEVDTTVGVSSSIILGKQAKIGSNNFDLMINPNVFMGNESSKRVTGDLVDDILNDWKYNGSGDIKGNTDDSEGNTDDSEGNTDDSEGNADDSEGKPIIDLYGFSLYGGEKQQIVPLNGDKGNSHYTHHYKAKPTYKDNVMSMTVVERKK